MSFVVGETFASYAEKTFEEKGELGLDKYFKVHNKDKSCHLLIVV